MRLELTVVASAIALAVACGRSGSESGPGEAGSVTAVSGAVTATRGAEGSPTRPLARGDQVFSDDTITTAPDATVTITLSHNGARWTVGGDTARRVDRSAAWRAAKGGDEATFTGDPDRTASAGRHTEAVPEVSRMAEEETFVDDDVAQHAAPAATAPTPPPPPKSAPEPKRKLKKREKQRRRKPPPDDYREGKDKGDDDGIDGLFDDSPSHGPPKLSRADIVKALGKVLPAVSKCGEDHDAKDVVVKVKILIAKSGKVSGALPIGDQAKTDVGRCVARRVKAARFPKNSGPPSVVYPFRL